MKNFLTLKLQFFLTLFIISKLCFCTEVAIELEQIPSQLQNIGVKLQILNAAYGILDNKIRSGENIALENKETKCFLEAGKNSKDLWVYTKNKLNEFNEKYIFQIEKLDGKPGERIKSGDTVVFKSMASFDDVTYYLGVHKRSGAKMGRLFKKMYFTSLETKKTDEASHWIIKGHVADGGSIALKSVISDKYVYDTKYAEKRGVAEGGTEKRDDRETFIIHRVFPPSKGNIFPTYKPYVTREIKKTDIIKYLNGLINSPNKIITNLNDGIIIKDNFSDTFGDLGLTHSNTNIYKQLKIKYKLDRRIYSHMYTDGEIVQIPTLEELIKSKKDVANRNAIKNDLAEIGFFPVKNRLIKISSNAGLTLGLNAKYNLFIWNEKTQSFEKIKTKLSTQNQNFSPKLNNNQALKIAIKRPEIKLKDIAVGNDGTILAISKKNQVLQVQLKNRSAILTPEFNQKFIDLSIENKNNIWLIDPKGNVFTTNLETKKLNQVGTKTFSQISAGTNEAWGLTTEGNLYRWMGRENYQDDKGWIKISDQKFKQISIGKDIWAIGEYKTFKWNSESNQFEEVGVAKHIGYITTSNTGEVWILVPEKPNLPSGDAVYRKAKMLLTLNHPIALQGSNNKYLSVGPQGFVSASTSWPESFVFVDPENPSSSEILKYQQKILIKSLINDLYITTTVKEETENIFITALEDNPEKATIFKIINQLNKEDLSEIEKGKSTPVFLETLDGLQLGTNRSDGSLYLDSKVGGFDKKWQIEDAVE